MGRKLHYHQCFSQPSNENHVDGGVKGAACLAAGVESLVWCEGLEGGQNNYGK